MARISKVQLAERRQDMAQRNYLREVKFMAAQITLVPRMTTREALREAWDRTGTHYLVTDGRVDHDALFEDVLDALVETAPESAAEIEGGAA